MIPLAWSIGCSPPSPPNQPRRAFRPACGWRYELHRRGLIDSRSAWYGLAAGALLGIDYTMWTVSIFDVGAAIATVLVDVQVIAFPVLARLFSDTLIPRRFLMATPVMLLGIALAGQALDGGAGVACATFRI